MSREDISDFLTGKHLYGDDFSAEEIRGWLDDEKESYSSLFDVGGGGYGYGYHALNWEHGFRFLPGVRFRNVLGVGSSNGDEFKPIIERIGSLCILEPSERFKDGEIDGVPVRYVRPRPGGELPFTDNSFDLITCFGTLHHIPNVSKVVGEMHRVLAVGGLALVREPIVSLGDWRTPRKGLTARERGIPLDVFRSIIKSSGFKVLRERKCMFPRTNGHLLADKILSRLFEWNYNYHPKSFFQKLRPTSVFYVLQK